MVIAVFGGTGRTGRRVVERALDAGHGVRVLARDPAKLRLDSPDLFVVTGDVLDPVAVSRTIQGSQAVLSLIGHVKGSPAWLQTIGTRHIVEAMKEYDVARLVTLSGGGLRAPQDRPRLADRVIRGLLRLLAPRVLADAHAHLEVLKESGLDWTVVRAPRLSHEAGSGTYRVGWVGVDAGIRLSRDDLAEFLLTQVDDTTFVHQMPFVSN